MTIGIVHFTAIIRYVPTLSKACIFANVGRWDASGRKNARDLRTGCCFSSFNCNSRHSWLSFSFACLFVCLFVCLWRPVAVRMACLFVCLFVCGGLWLSGWLERTFWSIKHTSGRDGRGTEFGERFMERLIPLGADNSVLSFFSRFLPSLLPLPHRR